MDFYDILTLYKNKEKLNFKKLGTPINKSDAAMRMAVNRKSLTTLEIEKLSAYFDLEQNQYIYSGSSNPKTINEPKSAYEQINDELIERLEESIKTNKSLVEIIKQLKK